MLTDNHNKLFESQPSAGARGTFHVPVYSCRGIASAYHQAKPGS